MSVVGRDWPHMVPSGGMGYTRPSADARRTGPAHLTGRASALIAATRQLGDTLPLSSRAEQEASSTSDFAQTHIERSTTLTSSGGSQQP